ncbi:MAG TPA: hypothetical protein VJG32_09580 [Anaerolineae bacterium]|nr:hypothetical protein [Anaerolineae bacterium]
MSRRVNVFAFAPFQDALPGPTGVYTVSVMTDTGPLQPWLNSVTATSANFPGEFGHRYTFVVTTTDNVNNVGQAQAETFARISLSGAVSLHSLSNIS